MVLNYHHRLVRHVLGGGTSGVVDGGATGGATGVVDGGATGGATGRTSGHVLGGTIGVHSAGGFTSGASGLVSGNFGSSFGFSAGVGSAGLFHTHPTAAVRDVVSVLTLVLTPPEAYSEDVLVTD